MVVTTVAAAGADNAAESFQAGKAAFARDDYETALESFEAAASAGLSGPAVHFNIGVSAYRLGRYVRAEIAFREVARTPAMAALAHYNLGLVAVRQEDWRVAAMWFARVERETTDEGLRAFASAQLAALPPIPERSWVGYASFGVGYDDNVALISDATILGVSSVEDAFAEAQFAVSAPFGRRWRFDAGAVMTDYQDLDRFDHANTQAGARYRFGNDSWRNDVAVQFTYSMLDGDGFQNARVAMVQTTYDLRQWELRGRYRFRDIDGMGEFDGVGGTRHEASARAEHVTGPWRMGFGYEFESSRHDDPSLSATRHQTIFDVEYQWRMAWTFAADARLQSSRYDQDANRKEDRTEFSLALTRALAAHWQLVVRYTRTDNAADRDEFDYERNRVTAAVEAIL